MFVSIKCKHLFGFNLLINSNNNMDLTQKKLSKSEWMNVEILVEEKEREILKMIVDGYYNVNIRSNSTKSMLSLMKMDGTTRGIHEHLYDQYFKTDIETLKTKYNSILELPSVENNQESMDIKKKKKKQITLNKGELIRIQSMDKKLDTSKNDVFEYILIGFCKEILQSLHKHTSQYAFYLYTILQVEQATILHTNTYVLEFVQLVRNHTMQLLNMRDVLNQSYEFIEKNTHLLKYEDRVLFEHQRRIFTSFRIHPEKPTTYSKLKAMTNAGAKLVLYTAPTGTGKTLTPLGLSEGHRIIFICAARHIGLALAKSAVSMNKRIAVAFGCETADDIRLHYYAASEYTRNQRSGGIGKVDNSVGDKVQIMICDVKSYIIAMHYMLAFQPEYHSVMDTDDLEEYEKGDVQIARDADLITYWDEPTIAMDYAEHPLHEMIHRNWTENQISKIVLSCATLPCEEEIQETIRDFCVRFDTSNVETISSYDCRKSITLLNESGKAVAPHLLYVNYQKLMQSVEHCMRNRSMLRYFDLREIVAFIQKVHSLEGALDEAYYIENYFGDNIANITMNNLKLYYMTILQNVNPDYWEDIHRELVDKQRPMFESGELRRFRSMETPRNMGGGALVRVHSIAPHSNVSDGVQTEQSRMPSSGVYITTKDAHTLTDGPTIFLTEDVAKIGRFYKTQSNIPERVFSEISNKIAQNSAVQRKLTSYEQQLEDKENSACSIDTSKSDRKMKSKNDHKMNRETVSPEIRGLRRQIEELRANIQNVNLDSVYVPNSPEHQRIWYNNETIKSNAFKPDIAEDDVCNIMALDVSDDMKLLLLLGIGVFIDENKANPKYMEIMKRLAYEQRLFVILASSDYIYGTNYQFCHGFIGKDLLHMTQQKTIQAMGRIGRNQTQQEYTVRFRDDSMLSQLFQPPLENKEAEVMNRLFHSEM